MSDLSMTKNGIEIPVRVNTTFNGRFEAKVGDQLLTAATWPELEKLVDKATKRVARKVDVPFTSIEFIRRFGTSVSKIEVRHGSATGMHSGTGNVLVRYTDGTREQLTGWKDQADTFRPLTKPEIEEYSALYQASEEASHLLQQWKRDHQITLKNLVADALNGPETAAQD